MDVRKSRELSLPLYLEPAICEACGETFNCGAKGVGVCWCAEIELSDAVRSVLQSRYRSCLCRACLENYAEEEKDDGKKEKQVSTGAAH
jgi:hypothetical protein